MKFIMAVAVYLLIGALFAWGILLTTHGKPGVLIAVTLFYLAGLFGIGCLPKKSTH